MRAELSAGVEPTAATPDSERAGSGLLRIGEAAARAGVSERTLRYYEQIGLLAPAAHSPGGNRRYGPEELARVRKIRELAEVMGLNLEEIRRLLRTEDHLERLRARWRRTTSVEAKRAILDESARVNSELRARIAAQVERATAFLAEIDERLGRVEAMREELAKTPAAP